MTEIDQNLVDVVYSVVKKNHESDSILKIARKHGIEVISTRLPDMTDFFAAEQSQLEAFAAEIRDMALEHAAGLCDCRAQVHWSKPNKAKGDEALLCADVIRQLKGAKE